MVELADVVFSVDMLGLAKIPPLVSLSATLGLLAAGVAVSPLDDRAGSSHGKPDRSREVIHGRVPDGLESPLRLGVDMRRFSV